MVCPVFSTVVQITFNIAGAVRKFSSSDLDCNFTDILCWSHQNSYYTCYMYSDVKRYIYAEFAYKVSKGNHLLRKELPKNWGTSCLKNLLCELFAKSNLWYAQQTIFSSSISTFHNCTSLNHLIVDYIKQCINNLDKPTNPLSHQARKLCN